MKNTSIITSDAVELAKRIDQALNEYRTRGSKTDLESKIISLISPHLPRECQISAAILKIECVDAGHVGYLKICKDLLTVASTILDLRRENIRYH